MNINKSHSKIGFVLLILVSVFLSGCINEEKETSKAKDNKVVSQLQLLHEEDIPDNMAMFVVVEPDKTEIDKIKHLEKFKIEEGQQILIIPAYNDATVKIVEVSLEKNNLVEKSVVYEQVNTEDEFGLLLETFRPEGVPRHKVVVEYEDESVKYLISYNGKDGDAQFEYVLEDGKIMVNDK